VMYSQRSHDRTAILAVADDQIAAVIPDGIEVESPLRVAISGDRGTVAYVGTKANEQCLCVNNSVTRCATQIGAIVISGDGSRIAWSEAFLDPLTKTPEWRVVTDGDPGPAHHEIRNLQLSSGGGQVAYIGCSVEGCRHVLGDRQGKTYLDIRFSVLSPDGSRAFYLGTGDSRLTPVLDSAEGSTFDQLFGYSFSGDGRHLAYVGRDREGTFLMLDGRRDSTPPELIDVALNVDGTRLCRLFKSRAGIWFGEGERTSPVFPARTASVGFSASGTVDVTLMMQDKALQFWSGADVTKLVRSREKQLVRVFHENWVQTMRVDQGTPFVWDDDGYCAWLERDGRQLRWRKYRWPPAHITKIDMAPREPGLRESRDAVLSALKDRSIERLLAYVDPDIRVGFGDPCCGVEFFRSANNLDDRSSPFWEHAQRVIESGGLLTQDRGVPVFTAPYTFGFPLQRLAPLYGARDDDMVLVIGEGAKLLTQPRPASTVLRTIDWEPAAYLAFAEKPEANQDPEKQWARIRTLDGKEGYIQRSHYATGFDLRAVFMKRDGRWMLTAFVSGD